MPGMFIVSTRTNWRPGDSALFVTEDLKEAEGWIVKGSDDSQHGAKFYLYKVEAVPVMQYTVVREVRGDVWDG